jgi:REP element-mobilizing transposase RayT
MTYYARNLPHWHPDGKALFVTWRLFGSLPVAVLEKYEKLNRIHAGKAFAEIDRALDRASSGPKWLSRAEVASLIVESLERGDQPMRLFDLYAFVVMPNHVHALLQPHTPLARITQGIKGATARRANAMLQRAGARFWQEESFDHWVRSSQEMERTRLYVEWNPVKAGLAARPEDWLWSSARRK